MATVAEQKPVRFRPTRWQLAGRALGFSLGYVVGSLVVAVFLSLEGAFFHGVEWMVGSLIGAAVGTPILVLGDRRHRVELRPWGVVVGHVVGESRVRWDQISAMWLASGRLVLGVWHPGPGTVSLPCPRTGRRGWLTWEPKDPDAQAKIARIGRVWLDHGGPAPPPPNVASA
ncbi:MAG: hypothetical protein U5R31_05950 [Acidimicrobiia bacterium]|nr:hypothetical protein [Acidimicrobiia bacterium]